MIAPALTASIEDYLEAILRLEQERGYVRAKDLAGQLGVTNASISGIMPKLAKMGLVAYERYAPIRLTPRGKRMAKGILKREEVLVSFFREVLGISPERAREEACRMEHEISPASIERLEAFLKFLRAQPRALKGWMAAGDGEET